MRTGREMDMNWIVYVALGAAATLLFQAIERRFLRKVADMIRDAREIEQLQRMKYMEPEPARYDEGE